MYRPLHHREELQSGLLEAPLHVQRSARPKRQRLEGTGSFLALVVSTAINTGRAGRGGVRAAQGGSLPLIILPNAQ